MGDVNVIIMALNYTGRTEFRAEDKNALDENSACGAYQYL